MTDFWKNKKIMAYIALAHHTRFLSPVMDRFAAQGAQIRYIVGQAERSQEITAVRMGIEYTHVFDYITPEDDDDIQQNYILLRDTFSHHLKSGYLFGHAPVTVIDKTIYSTAVEYTGFKNAIQKEKPALCFALHELNRWGKIFSFWSKKLNIPILTLQEGLYSGLDFNFEGHFQYSTLGLVWGNRVKKKLADFEAPADKIVPVGNTHLSSEIKSQKDRSVRKNKRKKYLWQDSCVILLLISGDLPDVKAFTPVFKTVSTLTDKKLVIKFHPVTNHAQVENWVAAIPDHYRKNIKIFHDDENTYDLFSCSDVCVLVQTSTTGLEALAFKKPLVQLDVGMKREIPLSFTELGVAAKMNPKEFADALADDIDFNGLQDKEKIKVFFENELSETTGAIDVVEQLSEKLIRANRYQHHAPFKSQVDTDKKWSILLEISDSPDHLLSQLESIAVNSADQGGFEVILIEPEQISKQTREILDSLTGDVTRLKIPEGQSKFKIINQASQRAGGETLAFLEKGLIPLENWLSGIEAGFKRYGEKTVFGARILDEHQTILHAGMVIDKNNFPVSTYRNLDARFPQAMVERPFQILDHFIAIRKNLFLETGGFWEKTGKFAFMDLCLRFTEFTGNKNSCIYLPHVCLVNPIRHQGNFEMDSSIHFFGKWHGRLWENETQLISADNLTRTELDTILLTRAGPSINRAQKDDEKS